MRGNTVRLGLMPHLTGVVGMYGTEITRTGQIACDEVNESGGVLGRPLELVIEDDGSLPESAVAAAFKLVDRHSCAAIIGNLLSNSRIAVAYQVAEPRRIPYLNFSFYEGSILSHYFFHFAALPNQQIDRMIPYMRGLYLQSRMMALRSFSSARLCGFCANENERSEVSSLRPFAPTRIIPWRRMCGRIHSSWPDKSGSTCRCEFIRTNGLGFFIRLFLMGARVVPIVARRPRR